MQVTLISLLTKIGLTPEQAKIYRALLELGEATVKEIAEKSGVKRTTAYYILEQLTRQNIVYETKYKAKTYFVPEKPEHLLKRAQENIETFAKNIELLKAIENKKITKPRIYLFDGAEGFKKIWDLLFKSGTKEYLIITDPREMLTFVQKGYITGKIIKEKIKLSIKSRQIIAFSEYAKEIIAKDAKENRVSKVLPHYHKIPSTTIIFDNKVALISPATENLIFVIESESFAKTQRSIFEALWEVLPEKQFPKTLL